MAETPKPADPTQIETLPKADSPVTDAGAGDEAAKASTPPAAADPQPSKKAESVEEKLVNAFVKATGFKAEDVLDQSAIRRTVVTKDGGKYRLHKGGEFRRISGPLSPAEKKALAEA